MLDTFFDKHKRKNKIAYQLHSSLPCSQIGTDIDQADCNNLPQKLVKSGMNKQ